MGKKKAHKYYQISLNYRFYLEKVSKKELNITWKTQNVVHCTHVDNGVNGKIG